MSLTKAIEKLANSQLTQQTKSSRPSPTACSSTEPSVSKANRPGCKPKHGHVEDQPSYSVTSSSELSSSSDGEDGWRYKRQKKQNHLQQLFANNRNVGPSDPEGTRLLIKQASSASSKRPLGSAHVIDKSDSEGISNMIREVQTSAEQSINPSDSDLVDNLIRHTMANATSSLPGNTLSEDTTCAFLDSMNIKKEEKKFSPKINDKLAQLVQQRWETTLSLEKIKEKAHQFLPPENAPLIVPLTNSEIWTKMLWHHRNSDLTFINFQRNVQKAAVAISQVADQILQKSNLLMKVNDKIDTESERFDVKGLIETSLDAVAILGHISNKLSTLRKENIRLLLSDDYKSLCKLDFTGADLLFGEDLSKSMTHAKEMSTITKAVFRKPQQSFQSKSTSKNKKILSAIKVLLKNARKNVSSSKGSVDTLRNLLQQGVNEFKAGQVKEHFSNWQKITSDPEVLQNIKGTKIPFITEPKMDKIPINPNFSAEKEKAIDSEIEKLLKKGVIKECEHEEGEHISPIFVSPKKDGGYRLILNLKNLNNYVQYSHFKMETLNHILKLIKPNCYTA